MHWIITDADPNGGERMRIGHGYLPFGNHGPARDLSAYNKKAWVSGYLSTHGSMFPYEWRTLDDDGGLAYTGRCGDLDNAGQIAAFAPLDFSELDCGATTMEYRKLGETEWSQL